ncbi:MAG: glutamine--fructose-6-phosphate transaminase (isomerizing) [Methanobacteriaceae archaeon]
MCGIVGCLLKNDKAAPILLESISKLEYRGYDSVGLATLSNGTNGEYSINIKKDIGKIAEVDAKLDLADMQGNIGIAHVRWATHGVPSKINSHPHTDCDNKIAIVHNGIIENYNEIKEGLESEGHVFKSNTDTEVIAHLLEKFTKTGLNLEESMNKVIDIVHGSYAIGAISVDNPGQIISARRESPLIVGIGDGDYFLASDVPAILKYTKNIIYIEDNELLVLDDTGVTVKDSSGNIVDKEVHVIDWTEDMAEKAGYDYFMIKEINEQADAVRNTLTEKNEIEKIIANLGEINRICFVACGTSFHASLTGKYLIEGFAGIPVDVILASEFKYSANALDDKTLCIFISQSGETADTLKALKIAKKVAKTLVIVNVLGSTATREADNVIYTRAGPEIGVAATKTYIAQLASIYLIAGFLAKNAGNSDYKLIFNELERTPDLIDDILSKSDEILDIGKKYKGARDFFFLGRGLAYPTALEGALKLKEITYIHAEGYASGELKHGPLALIEDNLPVVVVAPPGDSHDKTLSNLEEVKARGADVIAIGSCDDEFLKNETNDLFCLDNSITDLLAPILYVIPLQLLSYYISVERGLDPDKPKNLAKCVTVE